ncbi:MAG: ABC transporter permease [Candidatus Brockarchaeota archaeon]|nr:ABC transporter permease [Candidatus Brockarchaeota archaeon]
MNQPEILQLFRVEEKRSRSSLRQLFAVVWAQLKMMLAYKSWLVMDLLSTLASVVMYYFVGLQVDPHQLSRSGWGTSYLAFSLVGVATSNYLWACLTRLSHSIQHEIRGGTLETIAVTPINMLMFFIGLTARGYLVSLIYLVGVFTVGVYGLGAKLSFTPQSLFVFIILFVLMLVSNQALGLVAAGIIMVYKRGDPLVFILAAVNEFLAGVLYPLELLKRFPALQVLSMLFPYTYALDGMRRVLILGASVFDVNVLTDILVLGVFSMLLVPLGLKMLGWGYNRIRREGTTSSY